jgi:hypothetical protein
MGSNRFIGRMRMTARCDIASPRGRAGRSPSTPPGGIGHKRAPARMIMRRRLPLMSLRRTLCHTPDGGGYNGRRPRSSPHDRRLQSRRSLARGKEDRPATGRRRRGGHALRGAGGHGHPQRPPLLGYSVGAAWTPVARADPTRTASTSAAGASRRRSWGCWPTSPHRLAAPPMTRCSSAEPWPSAVTAARPSSVRRLQRSPARRSTATCTDPARDSSVSRLTRP